MELVFEALQFVRDSSITLLAISVLAYLSTVRACYRSEFKSEKAIKLSKVAWVAAIALLIFNLVELIVIPFIDNVLY